MYNLIYTKIKYPKNDTTIYEYDNLDNLLKNLKEDLVLGNIKKDTIIRIEIIEELGWE